MAQSLTPEKLAAVRETFLRKGGVVFAKACPRPTCHSVVVKHPKGVVCLTCGWFRPEPEWGSDSRKVGPGDLEGLGREEFRDLVLLVDPERWRRLEQSALKRGDKVGASRWEAVAESIGAPSLLRPDQPQLTPHLPDAPEVVIFTDGGCDPNPGPGGWAAVLICPGWELELAGRSRRTTNNRMELTAVVMGLRALKKPSKVTVVTDSQYVFYGMTDWITSWSKKGWRRRASPLPNRDLWEQLAREALKHETYWCWTPGHAGQPENERCDRLASAMIDPSADDSRPVVHRKKKRRSAPVPEVSRTPTAPIWLPPDPQGLRTLNRW